MKYVIELLDAQEEAFRRLMQEQGYEAQRVDDSDVADQQMQETRRRLALYKPEEYIPWRDVRQKYVGKGS